MAKRERGDTLTQLPEVCHWPEMERVNRLAQHLMDTMARLVGLSRGGALAKPGEYAGHMAATVKGYRRGISKALPELLEALSAAGHTLPRELPTDGPSKDDQPAG